MVAGYSGRDHSVMSALSEAMEGRSSFPGGLFWFHRGDAPPLPAVVALLTRAAEKRIDGGLVEIENFDETTRDLIRLIKGIDTTIIDALAAERPRWTAAPPPGGKKRWPVIRLNAVSMPTMPTICRRIVCNIDGHAAVREAIAAAEVDVLCTRTRAGVLAFGADADLRAAFEPFGITDFALHPIEPHRLRNETGERGLLREALSRAVAREGGLTIQHRRSADLLAPSDPASAQWGGPSEVVGNLAGSISAASDLKWREGAAIRIDWAEERPWVLIEPPHRLRWPCAREQGLGDRLCSRTRRKTLQRPPQCAYRLLGRISCPRWWQATRARGRSRCRGRVCAVRCDRFFYGESDREQRSCSPYLAA